MNSVDAEIFCPEPFHLFLKMLIDTCQGKSSGNKLRCILPIYVSKTDNDKIEAENCVSNLSAMKNSF